MSTDSNREVEMIAFVEVDGVAVGLFRYKDGVSLTVSGSREYIKDIPLHHQLQKARENWLREEIVKLEGMKQPITPECYIESAIDAYADERANNTLQTIIDRYHSELDQDTEQVTKVPSLPHKQVITNNTTAEGTGGNNFTSPELKDITKE